MYKRKQLIKCVIPAAGYGSRLGAVTQTFPKVMLPVGGKPILFRIMDSVIEAGISNFIIIVGYLSEKIIQEVQKRYPSPYNIEFVIQKEQLGLGHAIYQSKGYFQKEDSMLLIYGDTLFEVSQNLKETIMNTKNSWLGLYRVKDPSNYGVVELDIQKKKIIHLYEKPDNPVSNLAISGVNYFINAYNLFDALEYIISNTIKTKNEYQVTDAYDYMIQKMEVMIEPLYLKSWYDVGTIKTILFANQILLQKQKSIKNNSIDCYTSIDKGVNIQNSCIKNYTSIEENTFIENSTISNSIILENVVIQNSIIENSFICSHSKINNFKGSCILGYKGIVTGS